ncbi:hypothetical protein BH11PLA2_BH11PLA2_19030 [soil metagenome]
MRRRLLQYGPNTLVRVPGRTPLAIFVAQFKSLIVALLIAATGVAFAIWAENIEAVAILVVILLNAAIGFLTEWKAERVGGIHIFIGYHQAMLRKRAILDFAGRTRLRSVWENLPFRKHVH